MHVMEKIRWALVGFFGKIILWLWAKSCRITLAGHEEYQKLRAEGKPVIFLVWHGRIFLVPFFFRRRQVAPLVSPSQDGEIAAQIMARWGYRLIRGSSSHAIIRAWNQMKKELQEGGEVLIVPDGPRGPNRKIKPGGLRLAQEAGAYLVPFTFSASKRKLLKSWDQFLMFYPFSRLVAIYGRPFKLDSALTETELERESLKIESYMKELDERADRYFK
jgi:lysophospholipid acyltransferase (LPLAT)-like uncharacterized protein